jgi:predicted AAA+ superfamily ATPase
MKRDLEAHLKQWRTHPLRKPLILRGARQVGKSWLARRFGQDFENFVELNFDKDKNAKKLFEGDLHIPKILERICLYKSTAITPGKTLLFLDEIQECEQALKSLRYFKEDYPQLHVIAAGSLLDFTLEKLGFPVGRVQSVFVHPLSFGEYLTVMGQENLRFQLTLSSPHEVLHQELLEHLKYYFWLGGMPEVVKSWRDHHNGKYCQEIQDEIINSYKEDIEKYSSKAQIESVEKVFSRIPLLIGQKFKYNNIDPESRSKPLKDSLHLLQKSGIAHIVYHSSAQALPLAATRNERSFKVFFFDIGLAQRILKLDLAEWLLCPLEIKQIGSIAEQYVAQEYIAQKAITAPAELYYWRREETKSNAEVDFIFVKDGEIFPVEVKSGTTGSLKSMHLFIESHPNSRLGIKISESPFSESEKLISLPFYLIEAWVRAGN